MKTLFIIPLVLSSVLFLIGYQTITRLKKSKVLEQNATKDEIKQSAKK